MNTNGHTPGPWQAEADEREPLILAGLTPVAGVLALGNAGADMAEEAANARLIAAAPELLATLRQLVALADARPFCPIGHALEHVAAGARAALTRAEGRP